MTNDQTKNHFSAPLFAALVIVLAILACGGQAAKIAEKPKPTSTHTQVAEAPSTTPEVESPLPTETPIPIPTDTPAPTRQTVYQVGDIINVGSLAMVVLGWDSPTGDRFNKPEEGQKFVAVDVLFVNQGNASTSVSSLLQTNLKDSSGQEYGYDPVAGIAAGSSGPDGDISPGEQVRGTIGFQVPQDAEGLTFVFHDAVFGTGSVSVELGPEPVAVAPPAQLATESGQTMIAIGDSVEIAGLTLTIDDITSAPEFRSNKPDKGKQFMIVDTTVENKGTEAIGISTLLKLYLMQMYLKDATGQKHDLDLVASIDSARTAHGSEIAPGEKVSGQVAFQVPVDAQGLFLVLDAGVLGYGKILVALP